MRKHLFGIMEAHVIASWLAAAIVQLGESWRFHYWTTGAAMGIVLAPLSLAGSMLMQHRRNEPSAWLELRQCLAALYLLLLVLIAWHRWAHWGKSSAVHSADSATGARVERPSGRWLLRIAQILLAAPATLAVGVLLVKLPRIESFGAIVATIGAIGSIFAVLDLAHEKMPRRKRIGPLSPPPMCKQCGYNLTGNQSGVCPECGTSVVV